MIRLSRAAIFLPLALLAACGTKTAETPKDPNAPAGEVIAIEGSASAKRATATTSRTLALDADVFADDEITTAEASSVQIRLAHNGAAWTLSAARTQRVDASAAWSAPRQSGADPFLVRDDREDRTRAAARSGSQEGISSGEAALDASAPHRSEEGQMGKRDAPKRETAAAMTAPVPPPEPEAPPPDVKSVFGFNDEAGGGALPDQLSNATGSSESEGFGGLGIRGSGPGGAGAGNGEIGIGHIGTKGKGGGSGYGSGSGSLGSRSDSTGSVTLGDVEVIPADRADVVKKILRANWAQIRYCVERQWMKNPSMEGTVTLRFIIDASGTVSASDVKSRIGNIDDETAACITARAKRWVFPKFTGDSISIVSYTAVISQSESTPTPTATPAAPENPY